MVHLLIALLAMAVAAAPASAQQSGAGAACAHDEVPASARETCYAVAQAVESAQPQLGILVAGGNPTLGTASTGGLRLGVLPRVSASARVNLVFVRLPDILAREAGAAARRLNEAVGLPAPALTGTATVGVYPGVSVLPTVGGVGAVDLLGSVTWLPFRGVGLDDFTDASAALAYGAGVRVGLLRESFVVPGASVSLMYRSLGRVQYGGVCDQAAPTGQSAARGHRVESGVCAGDGDLGELGFDLSNWSGRATVGKRLLGLGLAAGVGYDRFDSDAAFGFRLPPAEESQMEGRFVRVRDLELDSGRWSAFVNGSFTALVATLAVEAGWLQGSGPIPGFGAGAGEFDPRSGSWFGSVGFRLAL